MADKAILDFPAIVDTFDTDVIYVVRGAGSDRDKHQTKANFLQDVTLAIDNNTDVINDIITGAQVLDTLTVTGLTTTGTLTSTGQTILARDSGNIEAKGNIITSKDIYNENDTTGVIYSGGSSTALGANIILFGGANPTTPKDMVFRSSGLESLRINGVTRNVLIGTTVDDTVNKIQVVGSGIFSQNLAGDQSVTVKNTSGGVGSSSSINYVNSTGTGISGYVKSVRVDSSNNTLEFGVRGGGVLETVLSLSKERNVLIKTGIATGHGLTIGSDGMQVTGDVSIILPSDSEYINISHGSRGGDYRIKTAGVSAESLTFLSGTTTIVSLFATGNVGVKTGIDTGHGLTIGSDGMQVTGADGNVIIPSTGSEVTMTRNTANSLWATTAVGYLRIGTNGRAISDANANVLLNADQSTTFNGAVLPTATSVEGSWAVSSVLPVIIPRGLYVISHSEDPSNYSLIQMFVNGTWESISSGESDSSLGTHGISLFSDGTNFKIIGNNNATTVRFRKF